MQITPSCSVVEGISVRKMPREDETEPMVYLPSFGAVTFRSVRRAQDRIAGGVPSRTDLQMIDELIWVAFGRLPNL